MSDTDSFIEEVSEEVRRDRLYRIFRRYGWIAILAVLLLVGGTAWNEWRKASERASAQAFGDSVLAALEQEDRADRADALAAITPLEPAGQVVVDLLAAGEMGTERPEEAATRLFALADNADVPVVYRRLATLKAVMIPNGGLTAEDRRTRLEGLVPVGGMTRLLAEEQLAMLEIETGAIDDAISRLRRIEEDAEATAGLRRRASELIVALGGDAETDGQDG